MGESGVGDAVKAVASENDPPAETMRACGSFFLGIETAESEVEAVEIFPHFAGDAVADGAGVFASLGDALHDGAWVVGVERQKFEDIVGRGFCVELAEESFFAGHRENGIPADTMWLLDLLEQSVESDVEDTGGVLGAPDVASQPEEGIGNAREHVSTLPEESKCLCFRRLVRN